ATSRRSITGEWTASTATTRDSSPTSSCTESSYGRARRMAGELVAIAASRSLRCDHAHRTVDAAQHEASTGQRRSRTGAGVDRNDGRWRGRAEPALDDACLGSGQNHDAITHRERDRTAL